MVEKQVELAVDNDTLSRILGQYDENLRLIEAQLNVQIVIRDNFIKITGEQEQVKQTQALFSVLQTVLSRFKQMSKSDLQYLIDLVRDDQEDQFIEFFNTPVAKTYLGKHIYPKTLGQKQFIDSLNAFDLVFAIGPAGTGKTYLAVCYAVTLLRSDKIKKIILTRPAVEAGENLGFLPGDLKEKVDPYLRPLYDALDDMLSPEITQKYIDKGIIEIAPLAYMRGRTLENAMIILDEAQNATKAQMKMFLTRLGNHSKMIVTGDVTQIDLRPNEVSGLKIAQDNLQGIEGISFIELSVSDVVRHPLVVKILKRFEEKHI